MGICGGYKSSISIITGIGYKMRYKLHSTLGPMKMPSQKMTFPKVCWFLNHFVRLKATSCRAGVSYVDENSLSLAKVRLDGFSALPLRKRSRKRAAYDLRLTGNWNICKNSR